MAKKKSGKKITLKEFMEFIPNGFRGRDEFVKLGLRMTKVSAAQLKRTYTTLNRPRGPWHAVDNSLTGGEETLDTVISGTMSVNTVMDKYDYVSKLRKALTTIRPDDLVPNENMRRFVGASPERWKLIKKMEEFEKYQLLIKNSKLFWAQPKTVIKALQTIEFTS